MGCPCQKLHATLVCRSCGATQQISYKERYGVLEAAKMQDKHCKKCYGSDFTIKD